MWAPKQHQDTTQQCEGSSPKWALLTHELETSDLSEISETVNNKRAWQHKTFHAAHVKTVFFKNKETATKYEVLYRQHLKKQASSWTKLSSVIN